MRAAPRGAHAASRRRPETLPSSSSLLLSAALVAEEELDAFGSNKAKKLRTEVVRPWRALIEALHHSLPSALLLGPATATLGGSSAGGDAEEAYVSAAAAGNRGGHGGGAEESFAAASSVAGPWMTSTTVANRTGTSTAAGPRSTQQLWARAPNHTALPLLWKNAVPLLSIVRHALEVLQSEVLVAVCGHEYAQLLLHLFLFHGYLSNLQPAVLMELLLRLLELVERTAYESHGTDATTAASSTTSPSLARALHAEVGSSSGNNNNNAAHGAEADVADEVHRPPVEQGTAYAALLVQLLRAPQLLSAFTPCEDEATLLMAASTTNAATILFMMQRLVRLTTQRHLRPTSALRLETHLLVAVNLLVSVTRDDYPLASATPLELVRPLCHLYYATARRDGWRMEALTLMTTQMCVCFSAVLGQSVRADIARHRPRGERRAQDAAAAASDAAGVGAGEALTQAGHSVQVSPRSLTLLHGTVLPFMLQLFTVVRSEFSHVSRRELFHFPCPPLSPLFDFGAVVLYLACATHDAYTALPSSSLSGVTPPITTLAKTPTMTDDASPKHGVQQQQQEQRGVKRARQEEEEDDDGSGRGGETSKWKTQATPLSPGETLLQLFRSLFFLDSMCGEAPALAAVTQPDGDDVANPAQAGERDTDCLLRVSAAAGGSLSAAAVQDLVKDGSLFMLHLLAQPGTTLGCSERQCTLLVEHGVLPLFPYYGVRLETLLLAVLLAIAPRASFACQQEVFRWLVRRYMPTVATQRDDESQPKEQVYRLLSVLLGHGVVGRWPLLVHGDERARLQAAAHFSAITARIRAVLCGAAKSAATATATPSTNAQQATAGLPPAMMTSLIAAATAGHRAKTGLSTTLFMAMLQFLSLYHHYGAASPEIVSAQRTAKKKRLRHGGSTVKPATTAVSQEHYTMELPSTAVQLSTGVAFMISGLSHAVCFFPHDEGVVWCHDTDTAPAAEACAVAFLQALRWAEEYVLAACLTVTEKELGWQHALSLGGAVSAVAKGPEPPGGHGGGKTAASVQRMKKLLARSRHSMDAAFIAPEKHVPAAVCEAAEGHWLLLHEFLASSTEDVLTGTDAVRAESGDGGEADGSELFSGRLRRGDVPLGFVEVLAGEVARAVGELAERAKMVGAAAVDLTGTSALQQQTTPPPQQQQQQQREVNEEVVAAAHRTLCLHALQLMHLLLRLFRLGVWQLPPGPRSSPSGGGDGPNGDANRNAASNNDNNSNQGNGKGPSEDGEDDLCILAGIPHTQLFDHPLSTLRRLSPEGQLYYAVMWISRHLVTRLLRGSVVRDRVLMRAQLLLIHDVGTVLLSQPFALWEPRQVVLSFIGVVCRRALDEGVVKLAAWTPTNLTSADAAAAVHATLRLSCSLLSAILSCVRRTRVLAASADPLVSPERVTAVLARLLAKEGLIPAAGRTGGAGMPATHDVLKLNPFLPFPLAVVDALLGLLQVLHEAYSDAQARQVARQLLETLFARYRYGLAESIFATFSHYAPLHRAAASPPALAEADNGEEEDDEDGDDDGEESSPVRAQAAGSRRRGGRENTEERDASDDGLLREEGRQLESFVDQLTDASRGDMPVLTPQLQCAVLSSIYGVLFRCDAAVAEKLGKYLFSFLSIKTAYVVRRHTALHVRWLFTRFTRRTYVVLQELLYRAREGIASISPMHAATSLRALGEAAHAAPMLEADIICTLLECWATQGFAHKGLLLECLALIGNYAGPTGGGTGMSPRQLCHYHSERLLFDWLWRLGHPMEAFPVACFGYAGLPQMWRALMPTLFPLALLCSARRGVAEEADAFLRPSDLLWRLAACHSQAGVASSSSSSSNVAAATDRTRELLVGCLRAHFPDVMARLLVFAALAGRHGGGADPREVAAAARLALEWTRSTFSTDYAPLVCRHADAVLCRFVGLVGTMTPLVRVRPLQEAVALLCDTIAAAGSVASDAHECVSPWAARTAVDRFFASEGGDHAYVLLQQLYVGLTHEVHRGRRRAMLAQLLEDIVRRWWSRELLQRVPHILHTVLRLCGNLLMACADARPRACNVLLYAWTTAVAAARATNSACSARRAAADEVFISTVMLTLAEDSRVVASTWTAICRADTALQRQDWQLQRARYTAAGVAPREEVETHDVRLLTPGANAAQEAEKREQHRHRSATGGGDAARTGVQLPENEGPPPSLAEAMRRVTRVLPLLKSTVFLSGAPASSFYTDAASAVDRARPAFVYLIRAHLYEEEGEEEQQQQRGPLLDAHFPRQAAPDAAAVQAVYEACCRAVQILLTLVCTDDASEASAQAVMALPMLGATAATTAATTAAARLSQAANRELQTSAFRLLRALCWCFIEAGAEGHVDALLYPIGAMQAMLQEWPLDEVLHHMYRQHVEQLYRLAFDADADVAQVAATTLRGWLCGATADNNNNNHDDGGAVLERGGLGGGSREAANSTHRRGAGDDGRLIKRALELMRRDAGQTEEAGQEIPRATLGRTAAALNEGDDGDDGDDEGGHALSSIHLDDILPFQRCLVGVPAYKHAMPPEETVLGVASLLDDAVWDALTVHEDESQFLRFFLVGLIRQYNLHHRFPTVATVLRHLLLRPVAGRSGSLMLFIEGFLPILLLHAMLLREGEAQRAQRAAWSRALETHLFRRAHGFRHATRLFLRALNVYHSVLMTVVRSHGVRAEAAGPPPFSRASPSELEAVAAALTFPLFVPSDYGELPELADVRESYWLADLDPLALAAAAVACREPHLAVLFTELSGESLLGRRKGIPSAAMTAVGQPKCSVLFPAKQQPCAREAVGATAAEGRRRGLRGEAAEAAMTERLAAYRAAVYAVLVDVETTLRFRGGHDDAGVAATAADGDLSGSGVGGTRAATFAGATDVMRAACDGEAADASMSPWEEDFFLQHPARLMEREKSRGNWHAVLLLLDRMAVAMASTHASARVRGECRDAGLSGARLLVEKANALLQLGAADSALQMLAAALPRRGRHAAHEETEEEAADDYALQLRSALAATLWRLGRWDADCLEEAAAAADEEGPRPRQHGLLPSSSLTSVDEGIFFAMRAVHRGEHNVRRWTTQALRRLVSQFDATNWFQLMLQAEALHSIEECAGRFSRLHASSVAGSGDAAQLRNPPQPPPPWVHASLARVRAAYRELELLDSVHHRLCVVYRQPQWWLAHLENSSARALRGGRPVLVHQWLSAYAEFGGAADTRGGTSQQQHALPQAGSVFENLTTSQELPAMAFLALVQARAEFVGGRPHRAIAILQNTERTPLDAAAVGRGMLFPMPANAPQMPAVVHQLVVWAREARLVPLSQLVRDPFLLSSVKNDRSGVCCLQLARLCHALVRDITGRLHSEEYRKLQESIEASRRIRAELEQQQNTSDRLSEAEQKLLQQRIRTLALETTREEDEWQREVEMYALYRRSALNAYARFLERSGPTDADGLLAVFAFVSLWLQQDARLEEQRQKGAAPAACVTAGVIKKAIKNIPHHMFLPLFSQLVAQLGTSQDDANLETLVLRTALESPLHTVWPLLALANGDNFGPAVAAAAHGGGLHVVDAKKVTLARRILRTLQAAPGSHVDGGAADANDANAARCRWRQQVVREAERLSAAYIQLAFYRVHNKTRPVHRIPADFMILEQGMQDLRIPPPTLTLPLPAVASPGATSAPRLPRRVPSIARYEGAFTTPGGINLPKALSCVLSDGRVLRQLLKSEDDLRQDSLIEQVFALSNQLLAKDRRTCGLHVFTYNVVPLAPTVGIIEWVDGTIPLGQYLNGDPRASGGGGGGGAETRLRFSTGAHERYFPGEPTTLDCRARLQAASKAQKHSVLLDLYAEFSPALHYFFLEHFFTPQAWLERRDAYTRSVAASSMVGYIVGLGDRHGNNLLLHTRRAELVHIDLGFAFDQGKLLPVPELVPFRLTRNVVDGFGVQGTEGPFRRHCEGTLRVLRGQKELLMTILEACAHDPLARWSVTVVPPQRQHAGRPGQHLDGLAVSLDDEDAEEEGGAATPRQRGLGVSRGKPTYADAERTLSHVAEKIAGYEAGELLSVPTHVHKLLQTAQNTELLAQMFVGWSPWL
ncbi:phosphatidylinositol kinase related protein [Trypanosoma conorhini]|uniref:non-specific serine/threonine protein kinase n=1 Tax=Trypanosoma conorhini TaxID=83891 RepID=A0A3R7MJX8_9TRYP|nr:phosphatidylinositol kinase related protein [Trypanosoma conorhini]RNF16353.1 phosphatidylinositol kinase related protein [Trypanosoma conorhini]